MKHKQRRALPLLTWRIALAALALWLVCMYAITAVTAESLYVNYWDMAQDFMEHAWSLARLNDRLDGDEPTLPGYTEYVLWEAVNSGSMGNNYGILHDIDHFQTLQTEEITNENVIAVFDPGGNAVAYSSNFFRFAYYDEETDVGDTSKIDGYAVCVLDWQMEPDDARYKLEQSFLGSTRWDALYYRLTGVLKDGCFTIVKGEYLLNPEYTEDGKAVWKDLISFIPYGEAASENAETVTLYTNYVNAQTYIPGRSFNYGGDAYRANWAKTEASEHWDAYGDTFRVNNLQEFILNVGPNMETWQARQLSLSDFVYAQTYSYYDWSDWDAASGTEPELEYKLAVAMLASPWRSAAAALRYVYIVTFLIAAVGVLRLRKLLKRNVIAPLTAVNKGISDGWKNIRNPDAAAFKFVEISELSEHYEGTKARLLREKDTIARQERALSYAREAEENRRQMTSNIAHELKTPLAIIHSYAEGLSERIAEDKREQYLGVILSETERMNDMVMEMLDLSRLEAGKVKLSREDFSLPEIIAPVFVRLERAIEAKELKLIMELDENCIINADMARIEQVITNFAVNAVKYTPAGGNIRVRAVKSRGAATLSVENDSAPFSSEALSKVWETFYSDDESRAASGTGLGLAIAKSIIALHGGKCSARNTTTGVEFSFTIAE